MFSAQPNMAPRTIVAASKPKFASADKSLITLIVEFAELKHIGPIPFTASKADGENHGREIYARALKGEFGKVARYVAPSKSQP